MNKVYNTKQDFYDDKPNWNKDNLEFLLTNQHHHLSREHYADVWGHFVESTKIHFDIRADLTFKKAIPLPADLDIGALERTRKALIIDQIASPALKRVRKEAGILIDFSKHREPQLCWLDEQTAKANIAYFCKRLNTACYGNAYSKNRKNKKQLSIISAIEGGVKGDKSQLRENTTYTDMVKYLHAHLLLQRPKHLSPKQFMKLIYECWRETEYGGKICKIESIRTIKGSAEYNAKVSMDSLDLHNTFLSR